VQIYRPQLTSVLSFTHRVTGLVLGGAMVALAGWLAAIAAGPEIYAPVRALLSATLAQAVMLIATFAFFYHLCNGVRHLVWDTGRGFELHQIYASGWAVVLASVVLTAIAWIVASLSAGGTA
jgi:succinate dehydrogenase / fumarate reductase cytochrome b subunit